MQSLAPYITFIIGLIVGAALIAANYEKKLFRLTEQNALLTELFKDLKNNNKL